MRVIFITGASSGIGEHLARMYAQDSVDQVLVLFARRIDRLERLKRELTSASTRVEVFKGDVTSRSDLDRAVSETRRSWGRIDTVYANAGFGVVGFFENLTTEDYRRQFETNVFGLINTIYATLEELKRSKGRLALLGSVASYLALPASSPYGMSKFAVRALAMAIRPELSRVGVSVTLISPGFVASEIRRVNNQGQFVESTKEPAPNWLQVPTDLAARKMVTAVEKRRREIIISFHGKIAVWMSRFCPGLMSWIIETAQFRGRGEPKS